LFAGDRRRFAWSEAIPARSSAHRASSQQWLIGIVTSTGAVGIARVDHRAAVPAGAKPILR